MGGSSIGTIFKVTTFGESHGAALGCVIDGVPSGIKIDQARIQSALDRRKPGQTFSGKSNLAVTSRKESDTAEILSGIFQGKTEGTPIAIAIRNADQHSADYSNLADTFRPGHADYAFFAKYGFRDYRGGGRSSGRETAARVAAGEVARQVLEAYCPGIKITAYTERVAGISIEKIDLNDVEKNPLRAADCAAAIKMSERIEQIRQSGDSAGGIVACVVSGVPAGLGEPVFRKLDAQLAFAIMSIGAIKGIEFGEGFKSADSSGSQNNDAMRAQESSEGKSNSVRFLTNNAGGIAGGISTGAAIFFRAAVKPVPSIRKSQKTVRFNGEQYENCDLVIEGRHDVCLCPRIVPVAEAMTAIVLADFCLQNLASRFKCEPN